MFYGIGLATIFSLPVQAADLSLSGHLKAFEMAGDATELPGVSEDAWATTVFAGRLAGSGRFGEYVRAELHPALVVGQKMGSGWLSSGVGRAVPEAVDLSIAEDFEDWTLMARVDWALVQVDVDGFRAIVGRQAISHGQGKLFTPLDLVTPFSPTTLDSEFKPGVDALRSEVFFGEALRLDVTAAHLGEWDLDGSGLVGMATATLGSTDLSLYGASLYGDPVAGFSFFAPMAAVGLYGDVGLTFEEDTQARVVLGVDARPTPTTGLSVEIYHQTFGVDDSADGLLLMGTQRYQRGELWLTGHNYAGLTLAQELAPLWMLSGMAIANVSDPSGLVSLTLAWSATENTSLDLGIIKGFGESPDASAMPPDLGVRSEFGLVPWTGSFAARFYF
jgi:hypothetical protein